MEVLKFEDSTRRCDQTFLDRLAETTEYLPSTLQGWKFPYVIASRVGSNV
jgi:hypothetical protein